MENKQAQKLIDITQQFIEGLRQLRESKNLEKFKKGGVISNSKEKILTNPSQKSCQNCIHADVCMYKARAEVNFFGVNLFEADEMGEEILSSISKYCKHFKHE